MFNIKSITNRFTKTKSISQGIPTNKLQGFNPSQESLTQDSISRQMIINERYNSVQSVIGGLLHNIAGTGASLPIVIRDRKTDKELTDKTADEIYEILQIPSLQQQSSYQLIFDSLFEYTLNGYCCFMLDQTDPSKPAISQIPSSKIVASSFNSSGFIISLTVYQYLDKQYSERYQLDAENNCYVSEKGDKKLFTSDVFFERHNQIGSGNVLLSKSILHNNYKDIATVLLAKDKNNYLIKNKHDAFIALFSTINDELMNQKDQERTQEAIQEAMNSVNNGKTASLFTATPLKIDLAKLNDSKFDSQFDNLVYESMKNIYRTYRYPILKDLEQSKYDNAYYAQNNFLEQCLTPNLEYIYTVLTRLFNNLLAKDSFYMYFDITKSIEYKIQQASMLNKNAKAMTLKEYRQEIGLPPLNDERDNQLVGSFNNQYASDDSF